jgi:uncharacterized membrane protein
MDEYGKSSTGVEENIVAAASYLAFLGLVILIIEKRSHFVRFHAVQSTLGFGILAILWLATKWIPALSFLAFLPGLLALLFAVVMGIKAYDGEEFRMPFIGNLAFNTIYETTPDEELVPAPAEDESSSGEATETTEPPPAPAM